METLPLSRQCRNKPEPRVSKDQPPPSAQLPSEILGPVSFSCLIVSHVHGVGGREAQGISQGVNFHPPSSCIGKKPLQRRGPEELPSNPGHPGAPGDDRLQSGACINQPDVRLFCIAIISKKAGVN